MGAFAYELTGTTGDETVRTGSCLLMGWSLRESAASAAVASAIIRDGTSTAGRVICPIELAADQSSTMWFGPEGIWMDTGIFLDRTAGTITGSIFHA